MRWPYWLLSLAFHALVLGASYLLTSSFGFSASMPDNVQIIEVSIVDAPAAKLPPVPNVPTPAPDNVYALSKLPSKTTPEQIKPEPAPSKEEPPKEEKTDDKQTPEEKRLAQASTDTAGTTSGTITEGSGSDEGFSDDDAFYATNPYHRQMFAAIRMNWRNPLAGPTERSCIVLFRVKRTGEIDGFRIEKESGNQMFDESALRAVMLTDRVDPFPSFWPEEELIVHLEFVYRP